MEAVVAAGVHGAPCVAEAAIGIGVDLMSLRHHLLSIAGIFLGLGLGILIGASVTSDQSLLARQQAMIDRLDADFAALSAERGALVRSSTPTGARRESLAHVVGSSWLGRGWPWWPWGRLLPAWPQVTNSCETVGGAIGAVIKCDMAALDGLSLKTGRP